MQSANFAKEMLSYVTEGSEANIAVDMDTDLIETGVVDSFSIMQLLFVIEEKIGVKVQLEDLVLDTIRSVRAMDEAFNGGMSS